MRITAATARAAGRAQPLKSQKPDVPDDAQDRLRWSSPLDGASPGWRPETPQGPEKVTEPPAERHGMGLAGAAALALAGVGFLGGLGIATPAEAAPAVAVAPAQNSQRDARDQTPVRVGSLQEAVQKFRAEKQLYVKGRPAFDGTVLSDAQMKAFQQMLERHPNVYLVMVDRTTDVAGDDLLLSRGIGNTTEFQSVRHPELGEKDGVLFLLFFNVNGDATWREAAMRAESLPDRLGVGEANWAVLEGPTQGEPRELLNLFVQHVRASGGQDIAGALGAVADRINGTVEQHARQTVAPVAQTVEQAGKSVQGARQEMQRFRREHGSSGGLANPAIDSWENWQRQAQQALREHRFDTARQLSGQVTGAADGYGQAVKAYEEAFKAAPAMGEALKDLSAGVDQYGDQAIRDGYQRARDQFKAMETALRANDPQTGARHREARESKEQVERQVDSVRDARELRKQLVVGSIATVTVAGLVTAFVMNRRAMGKKKEARNELDQAVERIHQRSQELLELMGHANYHDIANYVGKTKDLADQLIDHATDALTLMGGAQRFLEEAGKLIHEGGFGNWFLTGKYDQAIGLLTDPSKKLSFSFADSARKAMEKDSQAMKWVEELEKRGASRQFEKSLDEVLEAMADRRARASGILTTLNEKSQKIHDYLNRVEAQSLGLRDEYQEHQAGIPDGWFAVPSATANLFPALLGSQEEGGLIAGGRALANRDFVTAWERYAAVAERINKDAEEILAVARHARSSLVPGLARADEVLQAHEVKTEWAHDHKKELSKRLDETAHTAIRKSPDQELGVLRGDLRSLETRIQTVVSLDAERHKHAERVQQSESGVARAREEIHQQLQAAGVFKEGSPDQVLREPERDPSPSIQEAHQNLAHIKTRLDRGESERATAALERIQSLTGKADGLVADTRRALADYPPSHDERRGRHDAIQAAIPLDYTPSLGRIAARYEPKVMKQVAPDVGAGGTLADNIEQARELLGTATGQTDQAEKHFDQAFLLTARDDLAQSDETLRRAQGQLDSVTRAEALLAEKQKAAESELTSLDGRYQGTRQHITDPYVRQRPHEVLKGAEVTLENARAAVGREIQNPYDAWDSLRLSENHRTQVENAIGADKAAYDGAVGAIDGAVGAIARAQADIADAGKQQWSYQSEYGKAEDRVTASDLAAANQTLGTTDAPLQEARKLLESKDYETSKSRADSSADRARSASSQAAKAFETAKGRYTRKLEEVKEKERQAALTRQKIGAADEGIQNAEEAIRQADREEWTYQARDGLGTAHDEVTMGDLSAANSALDTARSHVQSARRALDAWEFQEGQRKADSSVEWSQQASGRAREAVSTAHARYERELAEIHRKEQQYASSRERIDSARGVISSAERAVAEAARQEWSYTGQYGVGTARDEVTASDLSSANSALSSARSELSSADGALSRHDFSSAESHADSAAQWARNASSEASDAITTARGRYDRAYQEIKRLEAAEEARRNSGGGGGGGDGGGGGGGGNGSTGGGTGGGGSGSGRGRW
ncbi:MAG: hypothetical protein HY319_10735 [Armatimonadetes bacterium]|nr:hypothetical protein [Armatimonadota bacterium]